MIDRQISGHFAPDQVQSAESDEALAHRAAFDPAALTSLCDRFLPAIDQYCRQRLREQDQVEDVVHQIFLKVIEGLRKQRVDRVRPWIFTIAHNEVVNTYRNRRWHLGLDHAVNQVSDARSLEETAITRADAGEILNLLPQLTSHEQAVLELRFFARLTSPEIAGLLGKSPTWVRTTQYRAITRLRALIAVGESS